MNQIVNIETFRRPRVETAKDALSRMHDMLLTLPEGEQRLFGEKLSTLVDRTDDRSARMRETTYRALLDDTCDLMQDLLDQDRVPQLQDRIALLSQIDAIREYGASVVR